MTNQHIPVLTNKVIELLDPAPGKIIIDCTLGTGGHAEEILKRLGDTGKLYGIDADARNLQIAQERLVDYPNVHYVNDNFENLENIGETILKNEGKIDGILFDLGLSALHVDSADRGFSFKTEGPLDMRFDTRQKTTAADIVNKYSLDKLISIFRTYGQEKFSQRIAMGIIEFRRNKYFTTTTQLADFIASAVPPPSPRFRRARRHGFHTIHPATRVFQALRIATNREIEVLQSGITAAVSILSSQGRLAVISYHSLEDRVVKHFFRHQASTGIIKLLTKKPIVPEESEIELNRRSRSAKLRAVEKN